MVLDRIASLRSLPRRYPRVFSEGSWALLGQIAAAVGMLAGVRIVTEILNPDLYGVLNLILGLAGLGKSVLVAPFMQAAMRFHPQAAIDDQVPLLRRLITRFVARSNLWLTASTLIGGLILSRLGRLDFFCFLLIAATYWPDGARTIDLAFLQITRRQKAMAILTVLEYFLRPALLVLAVKLLGTTVDVMMLASLALVLVMYWTTIQLPRREGLESDGKARAIGVEEKTAAQRLSLEILRYAKPLMPVAPLLFWLVGQGDRYVIGACISTSAVGIYSAVYGLAAQPFMMVQLAIGKTLMPVYYRAVAEKDAQKQARTLRGWFLAILGICGLGFLASLVLGRLVVRIFLASQYRSGAGFFPWIAGGYALGAIGSLFETKLHAQLRTSYILATNVVVAALSVLLPFAFVKMWGLIGAAVACPVYMGVSALSCAGSPEKSRLLPRQRQWETLSQWEWPNR